MSAAPSLRSKEAPLVDGEYPFTEGNFRCIAQLLRADSGIHLPDAKATLVYSRLAKRLRALGLKSFDAYCALVSSHEGGDERYAMMAALTTNVTRFYREPHHFDHLRDKVLAPLVEKVRAGGKLRLWSSACSTGQEPYSIALTVLQALPDAVKLDVRILATDIDPNVVETARAGIYTDEAVSPVPKALRDRYMKSDRSGQWRVGDEARGLIAFKTLNLIGEWPMKGRFDAIFCRNVVIYFDEPTQNAVWAKFRTVLEPGGRLYVGHSERVEAPGYRTDGLTVYSQERAR